MLAINQLEFFITVSVYAVMPENLVLLNQFLSVGLNDLDLH